MILNSHKAIAIVVSGGPAPGINSVISAVTIRAARAGIKVFGLEQGFEAVRSGAFRELSIDQVSAIHATGGSILGTSRVNPFANKEDEERFGSALHSRGISAVVVIGGDGSAYLSLQMHLRFPTLAVVHIPKTIDNDLVLPNAHPSFGFETARHVGTEILQTLCVDAKTTRRWYVVTTMGRRAGFLALGLSIAAGPTLTIIPEEFSGRKTSPEDIAAIIARSMKLRGESGKHFGVAVLAEGLVDTFDQSSCSELASTSRDALGRYHYSDFELSEIVARRLRATASTPVVAKNIGYELRCHAPTSFDLEYTRFLGWGAVELLIRGARGAMVVRDDERLSSVPLSEMTDARGAIRSRTVDLQSDLYRAARDFMIR